ncbi:hypothetical protein BC829DRAFT_393820 [Chytridium lagenaria]|nr:hypothetical protein BC829DRAFT_393820 [Chytridium lagenaria]
MTDNTEQSLIDSVKPPTSIGPCDLCLIDHALLDCIPTTFPKSKKPSPPLSPSSSSHTTPKMIPSTITPATSPHIPTFTFTPDPFIFSRFIWTLITFLQQCTPNIPTTPTSTKTLTPLFHAFLNTWPIPPSTLSSLRPSHRWCKHCINHAFLHRHHRGVETIHRVMLSRCGKTVGVDSGVVVEAVEMIWRYIDSKDGWDEEEEWEPEVLVVTAFMIIGKMRSDWGAPSAKDWAEAVNGGTPKIRSERIIVVIIFQAISMTVFPTRRLIKPTASCDTCEGVFELSPLHHDGLHCSIRTGGDVMGVPCETCLQTAKHLVRVEREMLYALEHKLSCGRGENQRVREVVGMLALEWEGVKS